MFTLTGTLHDHSGDPLEGVRVVVVPDPELTLDPDGNIIRVGVPRDPVDTDENGRFAVDLVTGPDLRYLVTTRLPGWEQTWFDAPEDGTTLDLRDVVPVSASSPMSTYVRGAPGPANVLSIGEVTTGDAGTQAEVTITGASPEQTLNFVLPKGDPGPIRTVNGQEPDAYGNVVVVTEGGGSTQWGAIAGDLIDQIDLQAVLDSKVDDAVLDSHVRNYTPHPAYDDMPSLTIIFQNRLV